MFPRLAAEPLRRLARQFPAVAILGDEGLRSTYQAFLEAAA